MLPDQESTRSPTGRDDDQTTARSRARRLRSSRQLVVTTGATSTTDPSPACGLDRNQHPRPGTAARTPWRSVGQARPAFAVAVLRDRASGYCAGGGSLAAAARGRPEGDVLTVTVTWIRCANGSPGAIAAPFEIATVTTTPDGRIDWGRRALLAAGVGLGQSEPGEFEHLPSGARDASGERFAVPAARTSRPGKEEDTWHG